MSTNDEQSPTVPELQRLVIVEPDPGSELGVTTEKDRLETQSWWAHAFCASKMKSYFVVTLFLFIICGSIVALISHRAKGTNNGIVTNDDDDATASHIWTGDKNTGMVTEMGQEKVLQQDVVSDNNDYNEHSNERIPKLRSYVGRGKYKRPEKIGHMNIYIREDARRGHRKSYQRFRFPAAQYTRRTLPFNGPFVSFIPWVPIFTDGLTKQTLIFSQIGSVYIIPPLINTYGQLFSIAELIGSGYASLVSSGSQPIGNIDMLRLFRPTPLIGPRIPTINFLTGAFVGGVRTRFGKFSISAHPKRRPNIDSASETKEEEEEEEDDDDDDDDNYQSPVYSYKKHEKHTRRSTTPNPGKAPLVPDFVVPDSVVPDSVVLPPLTPAPLTPAPLTPAPLVPDPSIQHIASIKPSAQLAGLANAATVPIKYHGGPVMKLPVAYVIWYGNWAGNTAVGIIQQFLTGIGSTPWWGIVTAYNKSSNIKFANSTNDSYSQGTILSLTTVQAIVVRAITLKNLPNDTNGIYFVLTSADVTDNTFCTTACGWHSYNSTIQLRFSFVGNAARCPSACAAQTTLSPNNNVGADAMVSVIAHEASEAVTDPFLNAWYDQNGEECADKCAWTFGTTSKATNGANYNIVVNGKQYLVQQNWRVTSQSCGLS